MKRARKGKLSAGRGSRKKATDPKERRIINKEDNNELYKVNSQEEEELRRKYFGEEANTAQESIVPPQPIEEEPADISEDITEETITPDTIGAEETETISEEEAAEINNDEIFVGEAEQNTDTKQEDVEGKEDTKKEQYIKEETKSKPKKHEFAKKHAVIFVISLIVIIFASVFAFSMGGLFNGSDDDLADGYVEPVDEMTGKVNVLLLGVDKEGLRTDTIVVVSCDMDDNTINMLSIPRDTRMYIGSKYQKINAAHAISKKNGKIAGPEGTIEAVTRLTGIPINYYVEFSFEAFRETIDALGGVYFDVPQNMNYEDPAQGLYIHLTKGYQLLDGDKAEQLVRFRRYPEGDIKRVSVQQDFIKAVADQKLNASIIGKLPELYKSLTKNVKTNFSLFDVKKYASALLNLNLENMTTYQLPGNYSGNQYNASYWIANMKETRVLVETVFGYDTTYATIDKAISGAVYGKTADPAKTEELKNSPEQPQSQESQTQTEKPKETPKAQETEETPKATKAPSKTAKPTQSEKTEGNKKPTTTQKPATSGENSSGGGNASGDGVNSTDTPAIPSTKPQTQPGNGASEENPSTPVPNTPTTPSTGGESGGFQRPAAN